MTGYHAQPRHCTWTKLILKIHNFSYLNFRFILIKKSILLFAFIERNAILFCLILGVVWMSFQLLDIFLNSTFHSYYFHIIGF